LEHLQVKAEEFAENLSKYRMFHHNSTWTHPGLNAGIRSEMPATNSQIHIKAMSLKERERERA
jgi:hypothetical protein